MQRLIEQPALCKKLPAEYGSPVHVVVVSEFKRNVDDLLQPIKARSLKGGLFFARKANKLPFFVKAAKEKGIGVDTASLRELRETLEIGVPGDRVVVTAIGKDANLIATAIGAGCLIIIDNADELETTRAVAGGLNKKARIGLRFSGFAVATRTIHSRFGFPVGEAQSLLESVARGNDLQLEVLHAHIDRYDTDERACAGRQLIDIADRALGLGIAVSALDLGGGILIRYLDNENDFHDFEEALISSVRGERQPFTFLADGLGYHRAGNEVLGKADLYPAWNKLSKERFVAAVLDNTNGGPALHRELSDRNLGIYFEPGRALLDNAGITLSKVTFRKRDTANNQLIGLAMNRTNLRPFRAEFCSDPFIIADGERDSTSEGAYIVGNLCSESDLIYRRKLRLPFIPNPDDIFCFVNTAGYLAHHMEIGTHGDALPVNVLLDPTDFSVLESFGSAEAQ
jgi:diaminopimelate decarboxylase